MAGPPLHFLAKVGNSSSLCRDFLIATADVFVPTFTKNVKVGQPPARFFILVHLDFHGVADQEGDPKISPNFKGGGQECPPYTNRIGAAARQSHIENREMQGAQWGNSRSLHCAGGSASGTFGSGRDDSAVAGAKKTHDRLPQSRAATKIPQKRYFAEKLSSPLNHPFSLKPLIRMEI